MTVSPPDIGDYDYTYTAVNSFGCSYDTTITVSVVSGPTVDAGDDIVVCGDVFLNAEIVDNEFPSPPCVFELVLSNSAGFTFEGSIEIYIDGVYQETIVFEE